MCGSEGEEFAHQSLHVSFQGLRVQRSILCAQTFLDPFVNSLVFEHALVCRFRGVIETDGLRSHTFFLQALDRATV